MQKLSTFIININQNLLLKMEIGHMRDYRVMDKDGRSCMYMYAIDTVETYVLGNRETRGKYDYYNQL